MVNIKFPETDLIGCRFPICTGRNGEVEVDVSSKEYVYKLLPGMEKPTVGTMAIVSCANGFQAAVVTTVNASVPKSYTEDSIALVVGFVPYQEYQSTLENRKRKQELKALLLQKKKELDEQFSLELYAEKSPEFKQLLDTYNSI